MAVRVGLVLSAAAIVAGVAYASQEPDRSPDLAFIYDILAVIGVAIALTAIWLGVGLASVLSRYRRKREP